MQCAHFAFGRDLGQFAQISVPQPVGLAARQAQPRPPLPVEPSAQLIKWHTPIGLTGPDFIQAVDEHHPSLRHIRGQAGQHVTRRDPFATFGFAFGLNRTGFARARVSQ